MFDPVKIDSAAAGFIFTVSSNDGGVVACLSKHVD